MDCGQKLELYGTLEIGDKSKKWFVLHTRPRREKKLAQCAFLSEIEYYLPLVESVKNYSRKQVIFYKVLLSSYLFVKCSSIEKDSLLKTGHIARIIHVLNQEELVSDLQRIYDTKLKVSKMEETTPIKEGFIVEITSGALIGLTGIVENIENPQRIIITVSVLNKAVSVALSQSQFVVKSRFEV